MNQAIGLFDSGLGGLTVLKDLVKLFPQESFVYVGDLARLPYGNKSPEKIRQYGIEIMDYLISRGVKAIIIACNSASSVFLEQNNYKGVPLLNIIKAGVNLALQSQLSSVAVLGTKQTINSHSYQELLHAQNPDLEVMEISCPLFVPLVEENYVEGAEVELIAKTYLLPLKEKKIKNIILGCTHYPLLKKSIAKVMDQEVNFIEGALGLKEMIYSLPHFLVNQTSLGRIEVKITDETTHFRALSQQLLTGVDFSIEKIQL